MEWKCSESCKEHAATGRVNGWPWQPFFHARILAIPKPMSRPQPAQLSLHTGSFLVAPSSPAAAATSSVLLSMGRLKAGGACAG